jgi:hypothetical protein
MARNCGSSQIIPVFNLVPCFDAWILFWKALLLVWSGRGQREKGYFFHGFELLPFSELELAWSAVLQQNNASVNSRSISFSRAIPTNAIRWSFISLSLHPKGFGIGWPRFSSAGNPIENCETLRVCLVARGYWESLSLFIHAASRYVEVRFVVCLVARVR